MTMETLMDFLETKGFGYSEAGVDVVRVKKGEISFVGYRMIRGSLSLVIGSDYAILYLANGSESILFSNDEFENIWPAIESILK
ncbi:hypothetical protein D3C86_2119830 [compost metagenome]